MDTPKIATKNSNGLQQRALEMKTFLYNNNIDILLVSWTYFAPESYMKILYCTISSLPSGKARGGAV